MNAQQEIIKLLREELVRSQIRNSAYSMRALAKRMKSSSSALSEILNGRRPITKRMGERLLFCLAVPPLQAQKILNQLPVRHSALTKRQKEIENLSDYHQVDMNQYNLIANWYYFGILSLSETTQFKSDPQWIAKRFGISVDEVKKAITTLLRLDLLSQNKKTGKLKPTGKQFKTSTDVNDASIRKSHLQYLDVLRDSLLDDPIEVRDFSSITITFAPEQMAQAKQKIKEFRRLFADEFEKTEKKEVYRLSIQFVPLTKKVVVDE